jgi:hypothetical protein
METTVKPVFNDHPWDPKILAVVDRWSLLEVIYITKAEIDASKWWFDCSKKIIKFSNLNKSLI